MAAIKRSRERYRTTKLAFQKLGDCLRGPRKLRRVGETLRRPSADARRLRAVDDACRVPRRA